MTLLTLRPRFTAVASAVVCVAVLAACGSDDDDAADTTAPAVTAAPATAAPATTMATTTSATQDTSAEGETIDVVASDYAFGGIPETVEPGTNFTLSNTSNEELHEMVVFKLAEGEERPVDELVTLPPPELEKLFPQGPPTMVQIAMPNADEGTVVLGDGSVVEPGRYLVACFIPQGADPQEYMDAAQTSGDEPPQVEGGPPHIALGMYAEFTVEG
jgi:plastocyanin